MQKLTINPINKYVEIKWGFLFIGFIVCLSKLVCFACGGSQSLND